jgi:hypothetical protein
MSKGSWRYSFTISDLSKAVFMAEEDVRKAKRKGEFDPADLSSVINWAAVIRCNQVLCGTLRVVGSK